MDLLQQIWKGVQGEFSDLPDAAYVARLVVRFLIAGVLGGAIGLQRERSGKPAGMRTQMIVCIGTAFFVGVPQLAGMSLDSLSRIIQGIAAGIGFLGAGVILKDLKTASISGVTTAASVWLTAALGIAVGMGREASAVIGTVLTLLILALVPHASKNPRKIERPD